MTIAPEPPESPRKRRARPCPICGRLALEASYPFCSPRCADVDLNRWMKGVYAIPVVEDPQEPGEDDEA